MWTAEWFDGSDMSREQKVTEQMNGTNGILNRMRPRGRLKQKYG